MDGTCTLLDKENSIVGMLDKAHFNWNDKNDYYNYVRAVVSNPKNCALLQ